MTEALAEAKRAEDLGEVPIGAVILYDGKVIAKAHNEVEAKQDATAHAEILALQRAASTLGSWRLSGASLVVTLEPCTMCMGALILSRVSELYFGCFDPRQGASGSLYDLSNFPSLPHQIRVYPEVLKEDCSELLSQFFYSRRSK